MNLLTAAIRYIEEGFKIFPCKPRSKEPLTKNGFKDSSDSEEQITAWWGKWPDANIGLPCKLNGLVVIDVDNVEAEVGLNFGLTRKIKSGRGYHYYYTLSTEKKVKQKLKNGIDIKYEGYVVAPPSVHESGTTYTVISDEDIANCPQWIADIILEPVDIPDELDEILKKLDGVRRRSKTQWSAKCPIHNGVGNTSLSITISDDKILYHCFNGCSFKSIADKLGIKKKKQQHSLVVYNKKGFPLSTEFNASELMKEYEYPIAMNDFYGNPQFDGRDITTADLVSLQGDLNIKTGTTFGIKTLKFAVDRYAEINRFNPIRNYLNSIIWDKKKRISIIGSRYFNQEDTDYNPWSIWLVGAVARVFRPGCKMDLMIILEGPQGVGKTSVLEILGREYYKNLTERITSKDIYATLKKAWIADFSELQSLTKNESSIVKNFLTIREDDYRKPYDVYSTNISRMCVFAGTTNEARYLKDITGNRRYLPYRIESANLKKIQFERDQIWAEAKYMYDHEKEWWVSERIKQTYDTVLKEREVEYTMDDVVLSFMESRKTNIVYRTEIIDVLKEKLGSVDKYGLFVRVDFLLDGKWKGYHRNNGLKFYKRVEFKPEIVKEPTITDADDVYL